MNQLTPTVKNLIFINVIMFVICNISESMMQLNLSTKMGMYYFGSAEFQPFQLFTHFFLHANLPHIIFNMISLYSGGMILEQVWGSKRLLNFFLICGIGAGVVYQLSAAAGFYFSTGSVFPEGIEASQSICVGASGAIFGLFAGILVLFPNMEFMTFPIPFPIKAKYLISGLVVVDSIFGVLSFEGDQIARFAHVGGFITGFILVKIYNQNKRRFY